MKRFTILLILIFVFLGKFDLFSQQTGNFTLTYTDRGVASNIYCWVPVDYNPSKSYPLLVGWHGAGDTGNNMRNILTILLAQNIQAVLACPDANKVNGKDTSYFFNLGREAYWQMKQKYNIDTNKTVVMGFSWGGAFSYQFGLLQPELFKGIIGHAPAIGSLTQTMWDNISKIRMATILGDKDFNYTAVNSLMNSIKSKGGELLYLIKPGVVHVDNAYFNSQEIIKDYRACYDFVIDAPNDVYDELLEFGAITIYPNPAEYELILRLSPKITRINLEDVDIIIASELGGIVYQQSKADLSDSRELRIDVSCLVPSVYGITVTDRKTRTGIGTSFIKK